MRDGGKLDLRASLARVASGGIPLRAAERLAEEAGPHRKLFTSDLSVSEYLLARDAQCEPISQVMARASTTSARSRTTKARPARSP
jgi:hypothetical protein